MTSVHQKSSDLTTKTRQGKCWVFFLQERQRNVCCSGHKRHSPRHRIQADGSWLVQVISDQDFTRCAVQPGHLDPVHPSVRPVQIPTNPVNGDAVGMVNLRLDYLLLTCIQRILVQIHVNDRRTREKKNLMIFMGEKNHTCRHIHTHYTSKTLKKILIVKNLFHLGFHPQQGQDPCLL